MNERLDTDLLRQRAFELENGKMSPGGGAIVIDKCISEIESLRADLDEAYRSVDNLRSLHIRDSEQLESLRAEVARLAEELVAIDMEATTQHRLLEGRHRDVVAAVKVLLFTAIHALDECGSSR